MQNNKINTNIANIVPPVRQYKLQISFFLILYTNPIAVREMPVPKIIR